MFLPKPSTLLLGGIRRGGDNEEKNDSVVEYRNAGVALPVTDPLTEVLRSGARELLQQAVEAEVAEFVARHRELKDEHERQRVVRNGYRPERTIQTGIGDVAVKQPRARDRQGTIKFSSRHPATLPATHEECGRIVAVVVLERPLDRRLHDRNDGLIGPGCPGLSAATIQPAEKKYGRKNTGVVQTEPGGQELRLYLG